jgi:hypothetical protein
MTGHHPAFGNGNHWMGTGNPDAQMGFCQLIVCDKWSHIAA